MAITVFPQKSDRRAPQVNERDQSHALRFDAVLVLVWPVSVKLKSLGSHTFLYSP